MQDINVENFILSFEKVKILPIEWNINDTNLQLSKNEEVKNSNLNLANKDKKELNAFSLKPQKNNINIQSNEIYHKEFEPLNELKCFKILKDIMFLEAKNSYINLIHKGVFLNLPNLIHVDLRNNKLKQISANFEYLKHLKTFKLDNNEINILPEFLTKMTALENFSISNNFISHLPSFIENFKAILKLNLSFNLIEQVPIEIGAIRSIEILNIEGNAFTEIPTTLCYLDNLKEFSIEWFEYFPKPRSKVIRSEQINSTNNYNNVDTNNTVENEKGFSKKINHLETFSNKKIEKNDYNDKNPKRLEGNFNLYYYNSLRN